MNETSRAGRVVKIENGRLGKRVGGAAACRMQRIPVDLGGPAVVSRNHQGDRAISSRHCRRVEKRFARDRPFGAFGERNQMRLRPEAHLVPFTKSAEWTIPGKPLFYATAMPRRYGAIPLVVTTHDGRPTKIDGNPLHPASGGATDAFAHASILDLYDPTRSRGFVHRGKPADRAAFETYLADLKTKVSAKGGDGLAFFVEETYSPTRERLRTELEKIFPKMRWCVYDPLLSQAQSYSALVAFGENTRLLPKLERADVILALDSDFLDCGQGDIASVRAFTSRRRISAAKDTMNRLYVVENRFTLTGAMADHRLRCPASQIPAFTYFLAGKISGATTDPTLGALISNIPVPTGAESFDGQWLSEVANDLLAKPGA